MYMYIVIIKMGVFWTAVLLLWSVQAYFCQSSYPLRAAPSSVAVNTENGEVFIAAGSQLLRLNNSLHLLENVTVSGGGELLVIALSPDGSRLVGCLGGDARTCFVYDSQNLNSGETATVNNAHYNPQNGLAIITTNESFYLGSEGAIQGQENANHNIFLADYNYTSATVRTTGDMRFRVSTSTNFIRHFYGGVSRNGYVYYFVADEDPTAVRVLRVCDCAQETCSSNDEFDALYEMALVCRGASETTRVCGVDLLESFADQNGPLVVVTQCDDGAVSNQRRNRACVFLLSDIDNHMDTFYTDCRDLNVLTFQVPWNTVWICPEFNPISPCDFGTLPFIDVEFSSGIPQLFGYYLINPGARVITASLAINVDGLSLLYVATSEGIEVYEVSVTGDFNTPTAVRVDNVTSDGSSVKDISREEGSDYITVTTSNEVSLYPLERCSNVSTCDECTEAGPLCGWCTVENKCSRRSQCQNSSEQRRWVNSSEQCITTSVTPDLFVLDTPTILNVTASSALPSNLTYNCSFSASGDILTLVVEAVEVEAGTVYQCNITPAITDLASVREVTDFSFVSVEVGILFATSEGALTIYDCNNAPSCKECVLTENICGWCVYGGVCSGTSDLCPVPPGVNNFYLMLGSSSGYNDVCPVVMTASTPSGHYTQPVNVARNLTLYTRNLPPPVEDFYYECSLKGQPYPAIFNPSDDTVSCYIREGEIMSTFQEEPVSLQLIWTNDNVMYSLNENSTEDIKCILYNCRQQLATSCSSCLSHNAPGFQCGWCSNECTIMEECGMDTMFITSAGQCLPPAITSVQPNRGPIQGGTLVTLTGTDLGTKFTDIVGVRLLSNSSSGSNCPLSEEGYVAGRHVVCETTAVGLAGQYYLEVEVSRDTGSKRAHIAFLVEQPAMTGVEPVFGPKSGGVEVVINGSSLDTGNRDETTVLLNGVNCDSISHTDGTQISCISGRFDGMGNVNANRTGLVEVVIDNAVVSNGMEFEFRDDPVYTAVSPQRVIPAGGIKLNFTGTNLDVVTEPVFVFIDMGVKIAEGECSANKTVMICVIPKFEVTGLPSNISYTIEVGNAPGPNLSDRRLTLDVKPNPVFAEDGSAIVDNEITSGEGGLLTIRGTNLESVEHEEIVITVGGVVCIERGSDIDDVNTYVCSPPSEPPAGLSEAPVVVHVGQNLRYNVGTLSYLSTTSDSTTSTSSSTTSSSTTSSSTTSSSSAAAAAAVGIGVGVSLFIGLAIIVVIILVVITIIIIRRRKRLRTSYDVSKLMEMPTIKAHGTVPDTMEMAQNELMNILPQKLHIPSSQIHLLNSIGHGEFGEVYKARLTRKTGGGAHIVAVKTLRGLFTASDVQVMLQEVVKMKDFNHCHIMPLIGVCLDSGVGVVMPYMANGSLLSYLKKERKTLLLQDEADMEQIVPARKLLLRMCLQIARGMEYLAQQKFVHRDLAARNCMLDHKGNVKVGDFGLAEDMYATGYVREDIKTLKVPYKWMSPESLEDGLFSEHSDVWSYGVTCWEIFTTGKTPYPALDPPTLLRMVREGYRLESPDNRACAPEMYMLIKKCWKLSPSERPCFSDLVVSLDKIMMTVADYLELGMTLVEAEDEEDWMQYEEVDETAMMGDEMNGMEPNPCYGIRTDVTTMTPDDDAVIFANPTS